VASSDALQLFDARRSPWTNPATGELTREAQIFVRALWLRVGGAIGQGTTDLVASAFEDAGIAEQQWEIDLLGDAGRQNPPLMPAVEHADQAPPLWVDHQRVESLETQLAQLIAQVGEMEKTIAGLQQGTFS
jgi:hypothetical protein